MRILNEPAASLDPIGESRVYSEFEKLSAGKTTLFISHRLGSPQLADEIFVFNAGIVAERGTHPELMELDGLYAEMYESQREW